MVQKRTTGCPLCGANLTAQQIWENRDELLDPDLGVFSARCPYCQGYLEIRAINQAVEVGYLVGASEQKRFDVALTLYFSA
jgi:C4-type Zn-finger protein